MNRFDLAAMARRANPGRRKRSATFRDIKPPATLASDLYAAGYAPAIALWQRYAARVVAEYERSLSALTTDAPADIGQALDQAEDELSRLLLILRPEMREWTLRVERWHRGRWRGAVLSATGVDLGTLLGPDDMKEPLEVVLERNVGLVKDVSAQARQRISNAVYEGLRARTPAREVAKQIGEAVDMGKRRAVNIASDQLTKLTSALADERRRQAGLSLWEWKWSGKLHGRPEHIARDGKLYSDDAADVGTKVEGDTVQPMPSERPGVLPYCGCRALARITFD